MQDENKDAKAPGATSSVASAQSEDTAPRAVVDGVSSASPIAPDNPEPPHKPGFFSFRAPSQRFMNGLLLVNVMFVYLPTAFYFYLRMVAASGSSGTEFLAIPLLFIAPLFLTAIAANLITIPLYLLKSQPSTGYKIMTILTFVFSAFIAIGGLYSLANRSDHYASSSSSSTSSTQSLAPPYKSITVEKATQLMNDCQVDYLIGYNGDLSLVHVNGQEGIEQAEKYPTGISAHIGASSEPTFIYASKAQTPALAATARTVRDKCATQKELKIYIDNTAELKASDGTWRTVTAP